MCYCFVCLLNNKGIRHSLCDIKLRNLCSSARLLRLGKAEGKAITLHTYIADGDDCM